VAGELGVVRGDWAQQIAGGGDKESVKSEVAT
jgi:hypothetical protein